MTQFQELLTQLKACEDAKKWAADKTWEEVYKTCHRGDWLLWLYAKTSPHDLQEFTLAKGLCANTARHLMKDERSLKAVDAAISFGRGEISKRELDAAYAAADAAYAYAAADAAYSAAATYAAAATTDAAYAAAYSAANAAYAAAAYAAADAAYSAAAAARKENHRQTADIVRSVLPIEKWNIKL